MASIRPHRHDVARYLVSRGAEIDILAAAAIGDIEAVQRCLEHDPDVIRIQVGPKAFPKQNPRSGGHIYFYGFGWAVTPHLLAAHFGHSEIFDLLMKRSSPWLRLCQACEVHDETLVREILKTDPNVVAGISPMAARRLVGACARNNTRGVELLLSVGWPADVANDRNQTPLHYAAWHGNLTLVNALLARNVPVNVFENEHGGSPLAWALHGSENCGSRDKGDYAGVARALLAAGARIPKPEGPLHATEEVLQILRDHAS